LERNLQSEFPIVATSSKLESWPIKNFGHI
jgi:hypothetical protein